MNQENNDGPDASTLARALVNCALPLGLNADEGSIVFVPGKDHKLRGKAKGPFFARLHGGDRDKGGKIIPGTPGGHEGETRDPEDTPDI